MVEQARVHAIAYELGTTVSLSTACGNFVMQACGVSLLAYGPDGAK